MVLTHRSRAEARQILLAAGLGSGALAGVMAAEDLALAALRHGAVRQLLGRGLRKSLILPEIEARFGIGRAAMAFIDDRMDNLQDLLVGGLGLALHAPSAIGPDGTLVTFDINEAASHIMRWRAGHDVGRLVTLTPRALGLEGCGRTGLSTTREGAHVFNRMRTAARKIRRSLEGLAALCQSSESLTWHYTDLSCRDLSPFPPSSSAKAEDPRLALLLNARRGWSAFADHDWNGFEIAELGISTRAAKPPPA